MRGNYFFKFFVFFLVLVTNAFGMFPFEIPKKAIKAPNQWTTDLQADLENEIFKDPTSSKPYANLTERHAIIETFIKPNGQEGIRRLRYEHYKECFTGFVQCIKISVKLLDKDKKVLFEEIFKEEIKCGQKKELASLTVNWPATINIKNVKYGDSVVSHMRSGACP